MVESPQRHREHRGSTEPSPPPTSQTQRHQDTKPTLTPVNPETQRRRGAERRRNSNTSWRGFRPTDGRNPAGRATAVKASSRAGCAARRPALSESAGLATDLPLPVNVRGEPQRSIDQKEKRQNRRAPGTAASEQRGDDERARSEPARSSPAAGDSVACRSAVIKQKRSSPSASYSWWGRLDGWSLVSFVPSWFRAGGWFCVFSVSSVPLWFIVHPNTAIVG
jgi:hypothetical protein